MFFFQLPQLGVLLAFNNRHGTMPKGVFQNLLFEFNKQTRDAL